MASGCSKAGRNIKRPSNARYKTSNRQQTNKDKKMKRAKKRMENDKSKWARKNPKRTPRGSARAARRKGVQQQAAAVV